MSEKLVASCCPLKKYRPLAVPAFATEPMYFVRFIFICFCIFANTTYSHNSLHRTDSHTNIRFDAKNTCCNNIRFRANIHLTFSHTGEYLLENIHLEDNIYKTVSEFSLANISIPANICKSYASMNIRSFLKIFASICFKI